MPSEDPLAGSLAALSKFFVGDGTLQETLDRVALLATEAVPAADMVGLTMLVDGRARTAVFTDDDAPQIDSAQYETGIGPCLDAFRHQDIFRIDDTSKDDRWRAFSEAAAPHGVRSTVSLPLVAHHEGVGALNFYSRTSSGFSDDDIDTGLRFAVQAGIVFA